MNQASIRQNARPGSAATGYLAAGMVVTLLSACVPLSPHEPAKEISVERLAIPAQGDDSAYPSSRWWVALGDAQLNQLVDLALSDAPAVALAQARLNAATSATGFAQSALLPTLDADASIERQRESGTGLIPPPYRGAIVDSGSVTLGLAYDIDLWGHSRALLAAAKAQALASQADTAAARLMISSAVVQAYYVYQADLLRAEIARRSESLRARLAVLNEARTRAGKDSIVSVQQSHADLAAARLSLAQIEGATATDLHLLAALTGRTEQALPPLTAAALPEPQLPQRQLTLDILAHRPDVDGYRRLVEAASQNKRAAQAAFYPDVSLSAFVGQSTIVPGDLFKAASRVAGIGPAVHLPIFEGGRLRANLGIAQAESDQAVAQYNQSVLDAIQQVADQLSLWQSVERQLRESDRALIAAQRIALSQRARLDVGLADRASAWQAELGELGQREAQVEIQARRLATYVALMKALGGGYLAQDTNGSAAAP